MAKVKTYDSHAVGKRKASIARVYLVTNGSGKITVNNREFEEYFPNASHRYVVTQPLKLLEKNNIDVKINVKGGGTSGQAGAIRLGVARALQNIEESDRPALKKAGFLTRDARVVERKKYGQAGARRAFQFSKR